MAIQPFPSGSHTSYERYVQSLSDAIKNRDWIYDPSYSLHSDSEIYAKVLRDPVTAHAIRFRKHLVAGATIRVVAASERPADEAAAAVMEDLLGQIVGFTDARILLADAIFRGSAYAMILGRRRNMIAGTMADGEDPIPLEWWVPEKLTDIDRRRFRLVKGGRWELWSVERRDWEPLKHPEWFVRSTHEANESTLGYGRGLLDTLYFFQSAKARALQDLLAATERFGQGFMSVAIENMRGADGRPVAGNRSSETVAASWQRELAKQKARHILVHDSRDALQIHNGLGEGWQLLQWCLNYLDNALVTTVLGSTLPTLEGDGGSRALGEVQENSTEALVQADRQRLADHLTRDLVGLVWRRNKNQIMAQCGVCNMPKLAVDQRKKESPVEAAELISKLVAAGVPLRAKEVYEKVGFTAPLPGDDLIGGGVEVAEGSDSLASFDMGMLAPLGQPPVDPLAPPPQQTGPTMPGIPSTRDLMQQLSGGLV
jgi:hypothetical protein